MNSEQIKTFREQVVPSVLVEDVDSPLLTSSFWVLLCMHCVTPSRLPLCILNTRHEHDT
jgi:hypothetical protein